MLAVGDRLVIKEPIGDGVTEHIVAAIQWVNEAGEIVETPAHSVQYLLDDGFAVAEAYVEGPVT